ERIVPIDDVGELAALVGHFERLDDRAVVDRTEFEAVDIGQRENLDRRAVRHRAKRRSYRSDFPLDHRDSSLDDLSDSITAEKSDSPHSSIARSKSARAFWAVVRSRPCRAAS